MENKAIARRELLTRIAGYGTAGLVLSRVVVEGQSAPSVTIGRRLLVEGLRTSKATETPSGIRFRPWHVETLLNQAADLLDRCLIEQTRFDSLIAAALSSEVLVRDDEAKLVVEEARVTSGYYDAPLQDAQYRVAGLKNVPKYLTEEDSHLSKAISLLDNKHDAERSQAAASLAGLQAERERDQLDQNLAALEKQRAEGPAIQASKALVSQLRRSISQRKAAMVMGGELDFYGQASRSLDRILADYDDAANRIVVAAKGLQDIYGFPTGGPLAVLHQRVTAATPESLNDAVMWVRGAIRWLVAFGENDQSFTVSLSMKELMGQNWTTQRLTRKPIPFRVPADLFAGHQYVRLRGVAATSRLATGAQGGSVRLRVSVPPDAHFVVADGNQGDRFVPSDQRRMPACYLGRVTDNFCPREVEVCGAISLMNASPIGRVTDLSGAWLVQIDPVDLASLGNLQDLIIELRVTGRPRGVA